MLRSILLLAALCLLSFTSAQDSTAVCQATIKVVERAGGWVENGVEQHIVDLHVYNPTTLCTFSGTLTTATTGLTGSNIGYSWGFSQGTLQVPSVGPKQTYSGTGFIISGSELPSITVTSFANCVCMDGPNGTAHQVTPAPIADPMNPTLNYVYYYQQNPYLIPDTDPSPGAKDLHMNVLILCCVINGACDSNQDMATTVLDSVGQPYTIINSTTQGTNSFDLINPDGSGKYYAIITVNPAVCYNADQLGQLAQYEVDYMVKQVNLYTYPSAASGVALSSALPSGQTTGTITYADAWKANPTYTTSLNTSASGMTFYDGYAYPTTIADSSIATPAINIEFSTLPGTQFVGAAFVNTPNGGRHLEFYFAHGTWALYSNALGLAWFNWLTNGLFSGARRIFLNPHTDDVFLETALWLPDENKEDSDDLINYRITPTDLQAIVAWQKDILTRMPPASTFKVTFPYNGVIVNNTGVDKEPLYLAAKAVRDQFFWESHTYTHPLLDNLNYTTVYYEWYNNFYVRDQLFDGDLSNPNWNQYSVITPSISGLFNGQALEALYELGIRNVCGDNSHPEQLPKFNYHGWYTNATNGFTGIYVVPRIATAIYFDASNVAEDVTQYNFLYPQTNYSLADIIKAEVLLNVQKLLQLRHDPYMFHQANMRQFMYQNRQTSLLQEWVEAIVAATYSYTTMPFLAVKHDDLAADLHKREDQDACGFQARLHVSNGQITGLYAEAQSTCSFPISGITTSQKDSGITSEKYGDEKTVYLEMTATNSYTLNFDTPVKLFS